MAAQVVHAETPADEIFPEAHAVDVPFTQKEPAGQTMHTPPFMAYPVLHVQLLAFTGDTECDGQVALTLLMQYAPTGHPAHTPAGEYWDEGHAPQAYVSDVVAQGLGAIASIAAVPPVERMVVTARVPVLMARMWPFCWAQ